MRAIVKDSRYSNPIVQQPPSLATSTFERTICSMQLSQNASQSTTACSSTGKAIRTPVFDPDPARPNAPMAVDLHLAACAVDCWCAIPMGLSVRAGARGPPLRHGRRPQGARVWGGDGGSGRERARPRGWCACQVRGALPRDVAPSGHHLRDPGNPPPESPSPGAAPRRSRCVGPQQSHPAQGEARCRLLAAGAGHKGDGGAPRARRGLDLGGDASSQQLCASRLDASSPPSWALIGTRSRSVPKH